MSLKYRPAVVEAFIDHYITGLYSISELCKLVDISTGAYYYWKETNEEFQAKLEAADKLKIHNIHTLATRGLVKLLTGCEYDETTEEFEVPPPAPKYSFLDDDDELNELIKPPDPVPVLKRKIVTKKVVLPNPNTVMFTLRNLDKANFPENKELKLENMQPIPVAFIPPAGMKISFPSNTDEADAG